MLDFYLLSMIVFVGIVGFIVYLDRRNIEFKYIVLIRRTKKGLELLDKIAKIKKFWKAIGALAIIVALFLMAGGLFSLSYFSWNVIIGKIKESFGGIVLPSPTPETKFGTGYILLPFWFWIIIIPTILFPHEIAHGIMSRVEKIRVKSAGLFLAAIFPGAFVEPDEERLKRARLMSRLKIFAVGSFANLVVALILFGGAAFALIPIKSDSLLNVGVIPNIVWPAFAPGQIQLVEVNSTGPAGQAGLKAGMIIEEVNSIPVRISYADFLSGQYLTKQMEGVKPGDEIKIVANGSEYTVRVGETTIENKTIPYLGIVYKLVVKGDEAFFGFLIELLTWMWMLNYAVAVFNILPIYPLDGGLIIYAIAEKITKKYCKEIVSVITFITIGLVLFSLFGPSIIAALQFS